MVLVAVSQPTQGRLYITVIDALLAPEVRDWLRSPFNPESEDNKKVHSTTGTFRLTYIMVRDRPRYQIVNFSIPLEPIMALADTDGSVSSLITSPVNILQLANLIIIIIIEVFIISVIKIYTIHCSLVQKLSICLHILIFFVSTLFRSLCIYGMALF